MNSSESHQPGNASGGQIHTSEQLTTSSTHTQDAEISETTRAAQSSDPSASTPDVHTMTGEDVVTPTPPIAQSNRGAATVTSAFTDDTSTSSTSSSSASVETNTSDIPLPDSTTEVTAATSTTSSSTLLAQESVTSHSLSAETSTSSHHDQSNITTATAETAEVTSHTTTAVESANTTANTSDREPSTHASSTTSLFLSETESSKAMSSASHRECAISFVRFLFFGLTDPFGMVKRRKERKAAHWDLFSA